MLIAFLQYFCLSFFVYSLILLIAAAGPHRFMMMNSRKNSHFAYVLHLTAEEDRRGGGGPRTAAKKINSQYLANFDVFHHFMLGGDSTFPIYKPLFPCAIRLTLRYVDSADRLALILFVLYHNEFSLRWFLLSKKPKLFFAVSVATNEHANEMKWNRKKVTSLLKMIRFPPLICRQFVTFERRPLTH